MLELTIRLMNTTCSVLNSVVILHFETTYRRTANRLIQTLHLFPGTPVSLTV